MHILLIKNGKVENCISADSVSRAAQFYPNHLCLQKIGVESVGFSYDGANFTPPPTPTVTTDFRITRFAFISRFTDAEAAAIDVASQGVLTQATTLRRFQSKINAAMWVDLANAETQAGVKFLESSGLIAAGRAAIILTAPIQAAERPIGVNNVT